jgi:hypothetical protein
MNNKIIIKKKREKSVQKRVDKASLNTIFRKAYLPGCPWLASRVDFYSW